MEWVTDLFTGGGLGTVLSGITGLIGGYLAKRENRKLVQIENDHEARMANLDMKADEIQLQATLKLADKKIEQAQTEGEIQSEIIYQKAEAKVNEIDAKGFAAAMSVASKPTGFDWVDKFRALTRPLLTWLIFVFILIIFSVLQSIVGEAVAKNIPLLTELYIYLVQSVIYLFIMAVSWWFMSRGEKSAAQIKGLRT